MKYDIEADWMLLSLCNFRCSYCMISKADRRSKVMIYASSKRWQNCFDATGKTWLIHITGGEPTLYPYFVELCRRLTQNHYLSINTNLSSPHIYDFAEQISPDRIHFINASVHWEELIQKNLIKSFIKHAHKLMDANFNLFLTMVMTPHKIRNFTFLHAFFKKYGLDIVPKILRHPYEGKRYPGDYSINQKTFFCDYLRSVRQDNESLLAPMNEPPTVNIFSDDMFIDGIPDYRGRMCNAGAKFVKITENGTVLRCGSTECYGNIILSKIRLPEKAKVCDASYCPYFCEKYSYTPKQTEIASFPFFNYEQLKGKSDILYYMMKTQGVHKTLKKTGRTIEKRFREKLKFKKKLLPGQKKAL